MGTIDVEALYEEIGSRIKNARVKANLKQEHVAEYLGLTRMSVANIEKGKQRPSIHLLLLIGEVLAVRYTDLIPSLSDRHERIEQISEKISKDEIVADTKINNKTEESLHNFLKSIGK